MINASFLLKYAVTLLIQVFSYALHIASTTTQSSEPSISISTSSGIRGKTDLAWGHCREAPELSAGCKKTKLVCLYCAKVFAGGGINRFKQYLAGTKGEVE